MKAMYFMVTFLLLTTVVFAEMTPNDISYYTENYPPYNFEKDGIPTGFATDVLLKIFAKLNVQKTIKDIKVVPWARGYNDIQKKSNVCLFTMTKTEERVKQHGFRWVGPIAAEGTVLFAKKDQNIKITSVDDMKKYRIAAIRDDVAEQEIVNQGYPMNNVDRTSNTASIIKKLLKGRADLWAYGRNAGQWGIKTNGFNPSEFEIVYQLTADQYMFYAFNKETPDSVVIPLQKAFDELKADGTVDQIISKYLK
ncbi:MAG: ABC transporter substrate-binding protein [Candidatus Magnetomorum sp.]|nr:ABC transporter substrate-binding protein [Candidatus Magnetomorum sp.]